MDDPSVAGGVHDHRAPASWLDYVRPYAIPGLSTCIADGLLCLDGRRIAATWIDVIATRLAEWAVAKRQNVLLLSLDPYDLLVPLTAAAVHVARMTELKRLRGGYPHTDAKIAVVTRRFRMRSAYRRLSVGGARLFDAVPAATRLGTGGIAVLGSGQRTDWGTLFVERAAHLRGVKGLTLIIVDLPIYDEWAQLEAIKVPKVVIGHDPSDRLVHHLSRKTPLFAWSADDLRSLDEVCVHDGSALAPVAARLEQLASGTQCSLLPIPSQGVCENAALFWSDIGALHRAARGSYIASELTSEAHELFQDLLHLAMPTAYYEEQTGRPFRARLRALQHQESRARGDVRDLYLPMVCAELGDLHAAVREQSPKADALITTLREHAHRALDVMLVARTAILARAYRVYVAKFPELRRVRVTSLSEVAEEMPADVAILTGLAPSWARHIYSSGIAAKVLVLTYSAEQPLPIEQPFVELEHVRRTIAYQNGYTSWFARPALKAKCWTTLTGEDLGVTDTTPLPPTIDATNVDVLSPVEPPDVPPGLWDIGIPSLASAEAPTVQPAPSTNGDRATPIEALRITFDDGRWVLLDRSGTVTRFNPGLQRADVGIDISRLAIGDSIVFLDGDARKDVLGKVLEVAKEIPHLAAAAAWVEYWRESLRRAKQLFGTYTAFANALHARGCRREIQTVRLWVVGDTIGPSDPLDVRRVGEALGDPPLRDHHAAVYQGLDAFRNAHAQLTQRVGALAIHVGPAASAGAIKADEIIDEQSGLTAADFQGCVEILRVRAIDAVDPVPLWIVGRLREARDMENVE